LSAYTSAQFGAADAVLDAAELRIIEMKKTTPLHLMWAEYGEQSVDRVQTDI